MFKNVFWACMWLEIATGMFKKPKNHENAITRSKKLIIGQRPNLSYSDRIEISTPAPLVKNTGLLSLRIQWIPQQSQKNSTANFHGSTFSFQHGGFGRWVGEERSQSTIKWAKSPLRNFNMVEKNFHPRTTSQIFVKVTIWVTFQAQASFWHLNRNISNVCSRWSFAWTSNTFLTYHALRSDRFLQFLLHRILFCLMHWRASSQLSTDTIRKQRFLCANLYQKSQLSGQCI